MDANGSFRLQKAYTVSVFRDFVSFYLGNAEIKLRKRNSMRKSEIREPDVEISEEKAEIELGKRKFNAQVGDSRDTSGD